MDGSGSVTSVDFKSMKESVKCCASLLKPGSLMCVYQFSSDVVCAQEPTHDTNVVKQAVDAMVQMRQTTNTTETLQKILELTSKPTYKEYGKIAFIFTDGYPDEKINLEIKAKQLRQAGVAVLAVGIGANISFETLELISQDKDRAFKVTDFKALEDMMTILQQAPDEDPCVIEFAPKGTELKSTSPLVLKGTLHNNTLKDIAPGATIRFPQGEFYTQSVLKLAKAVPSGETTDFELTLRPKPGVPSAKYPSDLTWELNVGQESLKGLASMPTGFLRGDFFSDIPTNVLVFGRKGAGKSSLINALIKSLDLRLEYTPYLVASKSLDHVTTTYSAQTASQYLDGQGTNKIPFVFWDTWGTSDEDYLPNVLDIRSFVQGMVPVGTRRQLVNEKNFVTDPINALAREIHVVLIVVPITSYKESATMNDVKKIVHELNQLQVLPLVVVTRIDDIDGEDLPHEKKAIISALPIDECQILFHRNYVSDKFSDKFIDQSSREILLAIQTKARVFHQTRVGRYATVNWKDVHKSWGDADPLPNLNPTPISSPIKPCASNPNIAVVSGPRMICEGGHVRPIGNQSSFCGTCGKGYAPEKIVRFLCPKGHIRADSDKTTQFCGQCGGPFSPEAEMKCATGHVRPSGNDSPFCGLCGKPYLKKSSEVLCSCPEKHVRPSGDESAYCGKCGTAYQLS